MCPEALATLAQVRPRRRARSHRRRPLAFRQLGPLHQRLRLRQRPAPLPHRSRGALATAAATAANRSVLDGESWTRQIVVVKRFLAPLSPPALTLPSTSEASSSKTHRGSGGPDPVTPVPPRTAASTQLSLQIVSDFWLPAAQSLRRMPTRRVCGELDEYCLGQGAAELLQSVQVCSRRTTLTHAPSLTHSPSFTPLLEQTAARAPALIQPHRFSGLQQHEWEGVDDAADAAAAAAAAGLPTPSWWRRRRRWSSRSPRWPPTPPRC